MTEHEMLEAQKRAESTIDIVRDLIVLESQVMEAREAAREGAVPSEGNPSVADLEARLKTRVQELNEIKTDVLPQIGDILSGRASFDSEARQDIEGFIAALIDEAGTDSAEQLAAIIIARLKDNLEKTFGR